MFTKLLNFLNRDDIPEGDKEIVNNLKSQMDSIQMFEEMKRTEGWKTLEISIKEEVRNRLRNLVSGDERLKTLLDVLETVDTKKQSEILEEHINSILP